MLRLSAVTLFKSLLIVSVHTQHSDHIALLEVGSALFCNFETQILRKTPAWTQAPSFLQQRVYHFDDPNAALSISRT